MISPCQGPMASEVALDVLGRRLVQLFHCIHTDFSYRLPSCLALCYDCYVEILVSSIPLCLGGNRSFAPILRQSRWSLLYAVYWLVLMVMNRCTWTGTTGSKYLNTVQDQNYSFLFKTTINKESMRNENKQQRNKYSNDEQNKLTTNNQ